MTQVRIFHAHGEAGIVKMEDELNDWLKRMNGVVEVQSITPLMCAIGPNEDRYQYMNVTVVYEKH